MCSNRYANGAQCITGHLDCTKTPQMPFWSRRKKQHWRGQAIPALVQKSVSHDRQ